MSSSTVGDGKKSLIGPASELLNSMVLNKFTIASTSTSEQLLTGKMKDVSEDYSRRIIEDIFNKIFEERHGVFKQSSSECISLHRNESEYSVDHRLQYWKQTLEDRKRLQMKLREGIGKKPEDVLFSLRTTIEEPEKQTVKSVMDYAERMKPLILIKKEIVRRPERFNKQICAYVPAIDETWPQAEREGRKEVEIVGLPEISKQEILGTEAASTELKHTWQKSKVLDARLEQSFGAIKKVVEFFPDIDKLQVVGRSVKYLPRSRGIQLKRKQSLRSITSSEPDCFEECTDNAETIVEEQVVEVPIEYGIRVNGKNIILGAVINQECVNVSSSFQSYPFVKVVKSVLNIMNIGVQPISLSWSQGIYYHKSESLLAGADDVFWFDKTAIRLLSGEQATVLVLYQPQKVAVRKERWYLEVTPQLFCCQQGSICLALSGKCLPPKEYLETLDYLTTKIIDNSKKVAIDELTTHLAKLVPLVKPQEVYCPYERPLDPREIFNFENFGFNCERFDDLELLKSLHHELKKPREPAWDFRLNTIKRMIMRIDGAQKREEYFAILTQLTDKLKGNPPTLDEKCETNAARERTRHIYVRGVICNGIEEWEELVFNLEERFFKPELQRYYIKLMQEEEEEEEEAENKENPNYSQLLNQTLSDTSDNWHIDEEIITQEVLKILRHSKFFRDSLYMHTYSLLCDIAENIVSVIESTDIVPQ